MTRGFLTGLFLGAWGASAAHGACPLPFGMIQLKADFDPYHVRLADLDGDGDLDAVSPATDNLYVIMNATAQAECGFESVAVYPVGPRARSVAIGDLNGDTFPDIVCANSDAANLSLLFNDGAGGFTSGGTVAVDAAPIWVDVGDLDGDGSLDIVSANNGGDTVSTLLNSGSGTFVPSGYTVLGDSPKCVVLRDVTGDGAPELFVSTSNGIDRYENLGGAGEWNGLGAADPIVTDQYVWMFELAELDGLPGIDIGMVGGLGEGEVLTVLNNGDGTYGPRLLYPTPSPNPSCVAIGDIDDDGDADMMISNFSDELVTIRYNNGAGIFVTEGTVNAEDGRSVALGDMDADGDLDAVLATTTPAGFITLIENLGGVFPAGRTGEVGTEPVFSLARADLNGDGRDDLVGGETTSGGFSVRLAQPGRVFAPEVRYGAGFTPSTLAIGDIDGDAILDVVGNRAFFQDVWTMIGVGDGTFGVPTALAPSAENVRDVELADMDKANGLDLIAYTDDNGASRSIRVRLNDGSGGFGAEVAYPATAAGGELVVADLNGDTWLDVAVGSNSTVVDVLLNNQDGTLAAKVTYPVARAAGIAGGDFDDDGDIDLVTPDSFGNQLTILWNDGAGGFAVTETHPSIGSPSVVRAADMNGDGLVDVMARVEFPFLSWYTVMVLPSNGDGTFGLPYCVPTENAFLFGPGDYDGDGATDLVSRQLGGVGAGSLLVLWGVPTPVVCSGDVDGDGDSDVFDFADLASNFGLTSGATREQGDLTSDGKVDIFDFAELAADFGCGG